MKDQQQRLIDVKQLLLSKFKAALLEMTASDTMKFKGGVTLMRDEKSAAKRQQVIEAAKAEGRAEASASSSSVLGQVAGIFM